MNFPSLDDIELVAIDDEERRQRARSGLIEFIQYVRSDFITEQFHRIVAFFLDKVLERKIRNLIITAPPQHGKSEVLTRNFPAYAFGRNPNEKIIGASYALSLASELCLDQGKIIDTSEYRELFPETRIPGEGIKYKGFRRNADLYDIVGYRGGYRAAGVLGGITGRSGTIGIIDDPIKDDKEAQSEVLRENIWKWYETTFRTRIQQDGCKIVTMTRWHEDDLVGRLLTRAKANPKADQWTVINFEALKEHESEREPHNAAADLDTRKPGEALAPSRYNVVVLETTRESSNPSTWNAMFRGRPSSPKGRIIQREWIRFYRKSELPAKFDKKITSWDLRFKEDSKSGDYVAGQAWARKATSIFLLGPVEVRERLSFNGSVSAVRFFVATYHWDAHHHLIENKANGPALENVLKKEIKRLLLVEPEGGKKERLQAGEGLWMAGNILLPHPEECPWILNWIEEIVGFDSLAHDDRVDAASQAINFLDQRPDILKALTKM